MFSTFFQPCELRLHLLQNVIFLHPPDRPLPEEHERPPQANDELVRGLVELYVPTSRHIAGIRVRLKAVQTIAIIDTSTGTSPIGWEDSTILEKVVEIGVSHEHQKYHNVLGYNHHNHHHKSGPSSSTIESRGRPSRASSAFGLRSSSPNPSISSSMARAVSRGRRIASGMSRIGNSPSPSSSRPGSRAPSPVDLKLTSDRGRSPVTREPPPYSLFASETPAPHPWTLSSLPPTPGGTTDTEHDFADISNPPSALATPLMSRRPSLTNTNSPQYEHSDLPFPHPTSANSSARNSISLEPDLATRLRDSLAMHDEREQRPSSSFARAASSFRNKATHHDKNEHETGNGKSKSRSSSVGWTHDIHLFGSKAKTRSKSGNSIPRVGQNHASELNDVDEEPRKGTKAYGKQKLVHHDDGADHDSGWETEPREGGLELQKGVHGFEFAFIIPCDAPPYERSPYGRVRYMLKATAIGAGRAKSNVDCWRDVYPMVNPAADGGSTPLTVLYNDLHPTVGLVSIACTSNNISVGGVFNIDINSPEPPPDLIVYLVRVSLETTIEVHTKKKGKQMVPVQRHKMFEKGWVPRRNAEGGFGDGKKSQDFIRNQGNDHAWTVQGIARIPDDNTTRPSTVGGSKASVRFSHTLVVEIVHSRPPPGSTATTVEEDSKSRKLKVFALRQPVSIPSCCCAYDAVTLPPYTLKPDPNARSADMPYDIRKIGHISHHSSSNSSNNNIYKIGHSGTDTATPLLGPSHLHCVCGMSLQDLSEQERALIPTQPIEVLDGVHFRHQGKIGELPSRMSMEGNSNRNNGSSSSSSTNNANTTGNRRRSSSIHSLRNINNAAPGAGIVVSLAGRRGSTSSIRPTAAGIVNVIAGTTGGGSSSSNGPAVRRRPSIAASIAGRSPSVSSRKRRGSSSVDTAPKFSGGSALNRGASSISNMSSSAIQDQSDDDDDDEAVSITKDSSNPNLTLIAPGVEETLPQDSSC